MAEQTNRRGRARRAVLAAVLALAVTALALAWPVVQAARLVAPAGTPMLHDRNGAFLGEIGVPQPGAAPGERRLDHGFWPLARLPDRVIRATLALEDRRFHDHPGIDPIAVIRAAWHNLFGQGQRSGASTLAMQIARMQAPAPRSLAAKAREAVTALALTWRYGREALLAHYLRLVPYGNGSHGIAHAARWYFDKPVEDLSWAEIALLSAIPQSPTRMNPLKPEGLRRAMRRGHRMLDELARQEVIGSAELALAHRQLAALRPPQPPRRPDALHAVLRYEALARAGALKPPSAADPRIRTTLDLGLQRQATVLARRHLGHWRGAGAQQVAIMVVDRRGGEVLVDIGSADYHDRRSGAVDFSRVARSPGSTLKPFVYALAFERGVIRPSDLLADLPEGAAGIHNADGQFLGPLLPRQALANSRNVPATDLVRRIGLEPTYGFLRELGLHELETPADSFGLTMAIGTLPTTLERLMRAYGALADDGRLADLVWFEGQPRRPPVRVLSTDSARLVTSILADPLARLPAFPRYGPTDYPFAVALKTGTSQGFRDAWTVAYSARFIVGVWLGRGDAGTMTRLTGAATAARLAHAVMLQLHGTRPGDLNDAGFPPPPERVAVELCTSLARSAGECGQTLTEWLRPDELPPAQAAAAGAAFAAEHRAGAPEQGHAPAAGVAVAIATAPVHLAITAPEHNSHVWRNPETPPALARLALKATVEPHVDQVVWYVDGEPFAITHPDKPVFWPVSPGVHRFQLRLPLQEVASKPVQVVVE
jgi:penicillin-binding protein 1C